MLNSHCVRVINTLILLLACAVSLSAQITTGDVTGTVTDQSGAAVAGASISAVCHDTQLTRTMTSGTVGEYRLPEMPACVYRVSVSAQGFKTTVRNVTVTVAQTTKADFQLEVGQRSETITVEAAAPLVDYSPGINNEVDAKAIVDLPTEGRDFKSILALTPGVQRIPGGGFLDVSISGQRTTTNNYLIDGMPNNDRFYGSEVVGQPGILGIPASVLGSDVIAEYTVQQLPSAENGVKGGAAINVSLKSGTNDLHGSAFYFGDYDWLNAKNFFSTSTTPYHNHNYGGTIGGPIVKNRTFFFAAFEGQRNRSVVPYTILIPTAGDVAAALANFNNPAVNVNNLPINPAGLALLKYYPCATSVPAGGSFAPTVSCTPAAANLAVPTGGFNQTVSPPNSDAMSSFIIKIDHKMNDKMNFSGRYMFADSYQNGPLGGYTLPPAAGSGLPLQAFNTNAPTRVQLTGATWTYSIAANKILDVRFNWSRYSQILDPANKINPLSLGVDTGPLSPADFGVPPVYASSITAGNIGGIFGYPLSTRPTQTYDTSAHFTWIKGTHTMKMGGNYQYASTFSLRNRGRSSLSSFQFDYPTFLTQLLLGRIDEAARSFGDSSRHLYQPSMGIFWQDEWKVTPRVTVSYGLRWEVNGALGEADKTASNFYPCAAPEPTNCPPGNNPPGLVRVGIDNSRLYNLDLHDFGPRAGVAWDMFGNGKTALRVGYSMVYDVANFAAISAPYSFHGARAGAFTNENLGVFSVTADGNATTTSVTTNDVLFEAFGPNTCYNPVTNTATPDWICIGPQPGSPNPAVPFQTYGANPTATPPFNIFGTVPTLRTPRLQYYSLTLQHELFRNNVLTVSYIGAHGTDMLLNRVLNNRPVGCFANGSQQKGLPGTATNTTALNCNRPFDTVFQTGGVPSFKYVNQLTNDGFSRYNAMQVTYRQRDWHGVNTIANFTWSNCIDTNSINRGGGETLPISLNPYDPDSNQGPCDTDVRLNFNTGVTYDFPKWSALGRLGQGWQIGGVYTGLTGRPWTPIQDQFKDNSGQDKSFQRANCVGPVHYNLGNANGIIVNGFEGTAGSPFVNPPDGTLGTCGRNSLRGPHFNQMDANLNKTTKITERLSMQLRLEVFNVLNHPNFNPTPTGFFGQTANSSHFGQITATADIFAGNPFLSQGGPRVMQLGLKFLF